jgi:hypothetical protein
MSEDNKFNEKPKRPYKDAEEKKIIKALKAGASCAQEICFETEIEYQTVIAWFSWKENAKLANRLSQEKLWEAKKKVMIAENITDARWLLTHHKDSKGDWSDRTEHTGSGGKDLVPLTAEKKAEIEEALKK